MSETIDDTAVADDVASPEDVLANMETQLLAAEAATHTERQARIDAENRAAQAGHALVGAHTMTLDSAETAQKGRLEQARANYKAAREAGDIDAEQRAIEESSAARAELSHISFQKTQAARQPAPQQQAGNVPGPAAQKWLADHPKSGSDPVYRAALSVVHGQAVAAGLTVESPEYFSFANRELEARFGADHGKDVPVNKPNGAGVRRPVASSTAAAPSRAGASNGRTGTDNNALLAKLNQIAEGDDPITMADFEEAAQYTYPRLDKAEAVAKYAKAQEAILGTQSRTITTGNGKMYRI